MGKSRQVGENGKTQTFKGNCLGKNLITVFHAEVLDQKDPNREKMGITPLRVGFVCMRADGSAVRLHPGQTMEAKIVEGVLEDWRKGKAAIHATNLKEVSTSRYKDGSSKDEPLPPPPRLGQQ